jgi:hypothetical protein
MGSAKRLPLLAPPSLLLVLAAVARLTFPVISRERTEGVARAVWVTSRGIMVMCTPG